VWNPYLLHCIGNPRYEDNEEMTVEGVMIVLKRSVEEMTKNDQVDIASKKVSL
jgi:hypothetical protein